MMKSRLFYTQLFGILLLILLLLIVVPKYSETIPKALTEKIENSLNNNGISWASVRAENRDITVSGIAPTVEEHHQAIKLAKATLGVRTVYDKVSPMLITPYAMNVYIEKSKITLNGYMPTKRSKKALLATLHSHHKTKKIIDKIDIGSGQPEKWCQLIETILKQVKSMDLASINIVNKEVHLSGKIRTEEKKSLLLKALNKFKLDKYLIKHNLVSMDASAKLCQERFNSILSQEEIKFESAKSILKPENNLLLQTLSDTASLCPKVKIEVIGHTDSQGDGTKNLQLSLERAKVVVAKLFELGINLERLAAKGQGELSPVADNATITGRAKNRRIEFKVMGI